MIKKNSYEKDDLIKSGQGLLMGPNTGKLDHFPKAINSYFFDEFVKKENVKRVFNNLPNISDIIENIPGDVISKIYNHDDLRILLLPYSINYNLLDNDNKEKTIYEMKVIELKSLLRKNKCCVSGKKSILIERIEEKKNNNENRIPSPNNKK